MKQARPRRHAGGCYRGVQHAPDVARPTHGHKGGFRGLAVAKRFIEQFHEPGRDRDGSAFVSGMMLGLWTSHVEPATLFVHVGPGQQVRLGRNAQSRKPAQGKQQSPLRIGQLHHDPLGLIGRDVAVIRCRR
ncbi:MAG TPA: hypothetical protein VFC78_24265 [Tepidisphaeraceae bacterium]|nr:hypothetical protein [Tepidisphaeraceae bacterium]